MKLINKLPTSFIENDFLNKMILYLDEEIFENKTVYITNDIGKSSIVGKNVVAIVTSDEHALIPKYRDKVGLIFKHYLNSQNLGNTYHIPLPYVGGFTGNSAIPINDRRYDVTFIGRNLVNRLEAIEFIKKFSDTTKLKTKIIITNKFMSGLPMNEYSKLMSDTKIAISPKGAIQCECLRFTEAVKCGCTIIACEHPLSIEAFNKCPALYLKSWNKLNDTIASLTPERLDVISNKMKICWEKHFSPFAVATYINKITRLKFQNR